MISCIDVLQHDWLTGYLHGWPELHAYLSKWPGSLHLVHVHQNNFIKKKMNKQMMQMINSHGSAGILYFIIEHIVEV